MIDVLYTAWNRRDYVAATLAWLRAHTDWNLVNQLVIYDDGSEDGTLELLRDAVDEDWPVPVDLRLSDLRSPPAIMNHYLATAEAAMFAKVDSDIALPGGWLNRLLNVLDSTHGLEVLGMEAGRSALPGRDGAPGPGGPYGAERCTHIGGVGLMRVSAFRIRPRIPERGRFGWTEHQQRHKFGRAWITPDLLCPQLDRIPEEPWASLAADYVERGWAREWGKYDATWMTPYWQWMTADVAGAAA
jgi:glycosyltransferase involved in cell wall biosynthesis